MNNDFYLFSTHSNSKYLYDANTNTVHPVDESIDEKLLETIYNTKQEHDLDVLYENNNNIRTFIKYVKLWRLQTDGFKSLPKQERPFIKNMTQAQKNQRLTSLAWDLILITTEQCNMRCAYCVYEDNLYPNRRPHLSNHMDIKTMIKAMDIYFEMNKNDMVRPFKNRALNIAFYGGEALLNFNTIKKGIEYARKNYSGPFELHIGISTNLTLFQKEWLPFLRDNEVSMSISIDGPKNEHDRYRKMRNGSPSFEIIEKKLREIYEFDKAYFASFIKANVTVNGNTNYMDVIKYFEDTSNKTPLIQAVSPLKDMEKSTFHKRYPYDKKKYIQSAVELNTYFEKECIAGRKFNKGEALHAFNYGFVSEFFNSPHFIRAKKDWYTGSCAPGRKITVTPDGNIHVCERIGNTRPIGTIDEGINEERMIGYFNDFFLSTDNCPECWARNRCRICPAEVDSDSAEGYFENRCEEARNNLQKHLVNIYSLIEKKPDLFESEFAYF